MCRNTKATPEWRGLKEAKNLAAIAESEPVYPRLPLSTQPHRRKTATRLWARLPLMLLYLTVSASGVEWLVAVIPLLDCAMMLMV